MHEVIALMSTDELWGTFAVDDHLRKRAYVADVVLFDRLVIPTPPAGDKQQWQDWADENWQPERLKRTLGELGELAVPIPWTQNLRARWSDAYDSMMLAPPDERLRVGQDAALDVKNIKGAPEDQPSRYVTRKVLAEQLNDPADEALYRAVKANSLSLAADIETVVGYGSFEKFQRELPLTVSQKRQRAKTDDAMAFGWDFFVPEDSNLDDAELLKRAVSLSRKDEFRASRREFHQWRRKLLSKKIGPEAARDEMNRCLAAYNRIVSKSQLRHRVLTALQVCTIVAPAADFALMGLGIAGGVLFGAAAFAAERLMPEAKPGPDERVAALVHDARKAFGWRAGTHPSYARA
jgi:hypothetical protein